MVDSDSFVYKELKENVERVEEFKVPYLVRARAVLGLANVLWAEFRGRCGGRKRNPSQTLGTDGGLFSVTSGPPADVKTSWL